MPFVKYAGQTVTDSLEEYLFWFEQKGLASELRPLLQPCLALKLNFLMGNQKNRTSIVAQ